MRKCQRRNRWDEYLTTVTDLNGSEHDIKIEFEFDIENDGIGPYEFWGAKGYDYGNDYMVINEVTGAYLIRTGYCNTEDEIPKCKNVKVEKIHDYYRWTHTRKIGNDGAGVDQAVQQANEDYDWQDNNFYDDYEED